MYVIGIDPHRGSHAAAVLDGDERVRAVLQLPADRQQRQRLLSWANGFTPRLWAVEGATGTGALLAQQLVAAGEQVVDVPPKLAARVRLLDNNHSDKTDSHDARSTAIVALRNARLRQVGLEDHTAVLRLLAKRHHDLIAAGRGRCADCTPPCASSSKATCRGGYGLNGPPGSWLASARPRRSMSNARRWPVIFLPKSAATIGSSPSTSSGPRSGCGVGHHAHRAARGRADRRRLRPRLQRRHRPVPKRRALRPLQRDRPDRSLQRPGDPAPAQPARQPPAEPRHPHDRRHPDPQRHTRTRLLPAQADRGPQPQRSDARPQAAHQRRRLPPTRRRQPPLTSGPGRAHGNVSNGQRDRLYTLTAGSSVKPLPDPPPRYAHHATRLSRRAPTSALDTNRIRSGTPCQPKSSSFAVRAGRGPCRQTIMRAPSPARGAAPGGTIATASRRRRT